MYPLLGICDILLQHLLGQNVLADSLWLSLICLMVRMSLGVAADNELGQPLVIDWIHNVFDDT